MELELAALYQNGTWDFVCTLPACKHIVGCKQVYIVKFHPDGSVDRLNAQLVAKGYTQT